MVYTANWVISCQKIACIFLHVRCLEKVPKYWCKIRDFHPMGSQSVKKNHQRNKSNFFQGWAEPYRVFFGGKTKPLQKSMVNFRGISDLHGKNSALFWGVGVIEWRLDLNCSRYILRFLDLGDLQVTDPMAAIVTKMLYQKILSLCSGHSPEPKTHGSRIGLLSWKLTCPLKINGWKMYSLLKQSLFRGHVNFRGCTHQEI